MAKAKHFCGKCGRKFDSEAAYLKHTCRETGFTPRDSKHFETNIKEIPEEALPGEKIIYLSEKKIIKALKKSRIKDNA